MSKVWFLTGSSKGFGRVWAEAALDRGDRVVATARDVRTLDDLSERYGDLVLALALDVTDKAAVDAAIAQAHAHFGRLDVVVNNAGYGLFGMTEEVTEEQARAQMETNFFGALWVTQAAVRIMREQGSGHLLQVSSIGGVLTAPLFPVYHASKWALEGLSDSLAQAVEGFGIRVTLVEPGGFATDWSGASAVHAEADPAYDAVRAATYARFAQGGVTPGDPHATAEAILRLVDADEPPLRLFLGDGPFALIKQVYAGRLAEWEAWDDVAVAAHGKAAA